MKTTSRRIIGALLVLSVTWLIVPNVRADDADYVTEINQYINQIYEDQKARDDYMQSIQDGIDQVIKQRDELLDRGSDQPWQASAPVPPQASAPVPPKVQVPVPVVAAQAPPKGAVPAFRLQIFNGATPTNVGYYRDASGQLRLMSVPQ